MDFHRVLVFNKCFCCSKNYNVSQLIELNTNSVIVGEETIDFCDLILDVCLVSLDNQKKNYICDDCKNQLVYFHMFKRDVKRYSSFTESLNSLLILAQVERILQSFKDLSGYQVVQNERCIIIEPCEGMQIETAFQAPLLNTAVESNVEYQEEITEEYIEEQIETQTFLKDECLEEKLESNEIIYEVKPLEIKDRTNEEVPIRPKRKRTRKYKYPINTNEKLTDEEKDWINRQVRNCEVMKSGQIAYKCPLCETVLQIAGSLKKHLRDSHILKSEKDQDSWNSKKAFRTEIQQSRLILETADGTETIWKCQRCDINRIFRSEAGLKVHIRYNHIRCQVIDAKFIAQCKIVIDHENGQKDAWKCPECSKILSSRDGLRNHLKLEHPDSVGQNDEISSDRLPNNTRYDHENLLYLLKTKRRSWKSDHTSNACIDCGIQFINHTAKKEKSCRIHEECHKILQVVSPFYQLPKCEVTKTMFSKVEDLNKFLTNDERFFEIPSEGMTTRVSRKYKESIGTAEINGPEAWKCGHCRVSYQTEVECNAHVMILHSKKLICPIDHMEFEGSRGIGLFNSHMRNRHSDMFPDIIISCTYCQAEFSSVFEKLAHMKTCSEKKFECDHCSRKFFTKIELIRHLKIVSGEISYVCEICSKSCSSTMDLKLHRTAHTNEKSYACSYPECSKAFKTPAARSSHMETHSNVSYTCTFCPSTFKQRALLQRHLRKGFCRRSSKEMSRNSFIYDEYIEVTDVLN